MPDGRTRAISLAAKATPSARSRYREAPSLRQRVEANDLPRLEERLPDIPLVVAPISEPGRYGGTIRRAVIADIIDRTAVSKTLNENLMGYERPLARAIQLNLAESYEFIDEGRSVIFKLRQGTRWSDGEPFKVDDILFWYEDVALNENARNDPLFPSRWINAGQPVKLTKIDELTLKISSRQPLGSILNTLCFDELALPKHRFARFHPRYNEKATYDDFRERTTRARLAFEPGTPRLSAWAPVFWARHQRAVFERNPYYWKVDPEGNQLPYVDRLEFAVIPSSDVILLRFLNGELDLIGRYLVSTSYQTLKDRERQGMFTVYLSEALPNLALYLNWDAPRLMLRKAFRKPGVRKALSYAINRQEIGNIVYSGLFRPIGISFSRTSPVYTPESAAMYAEYLPEKARALLDAEGYTDTNGDGYREFEDGARFEITLDVFANTNIPDIAELIVDQWAGIGIKTHLKIALQEIIVPRRINGEFEITITGASGNPLITPYKFSIAGPNEPFWHRHGDLEGPPWLKEISVLIDQAKRTFDAAERARLVERIRELHVENLPFLTLGESQGVWAASNRLANVPQVINLEDVTRGWDRAIFSEQLYFRE